MRIVRCILTIALCLGAYFEAGICTAVSLFLLMVAVELKHLLLKED